jgi:hypothetical protein
VESGPTQVAKSSGSVAVFWILDKAASFVNFIKRHVWYRSDSRLTVDTSDSAACEPGCAKTPEVDVRVQQTCGLGDSFIREQHSV